MAAGVSLATSKYLPLRCRFYAASARACEIAGRPTAADKAVKLMLDSIRALRADEQMQLPLPAQLETRLQAAEVDAAILGFRHQVRSEIFESEARFDELLAALTPENKARALFEACCDFSARGLQEAAMEDDQAHKRDKALALACVAERAALNVPQLLGLENCTHLSSSV